MKTILNVVISQNDDGVIEHTYCSDRIEIASFTEEELVEIRNRLGTIAFKLLSIKSKLSDKIS